MKLTVTIPAASFEVTCGQAIQLPIELLVENSVDTPPAIPDQPGIAEFSVTPSAVEHGQVALLRWRTEDAKEVTLDDSGVEPEGEASVNPDVTTTWTLRASNDAGATQAECTLKVKASAPVDRTWRPKDAEELQDAADRAREGDVILVDPRYTYAGRLVLRRQNSGKPIEIFSEEGGLSGDHIPRDWSSWQHAGKIVGPLDGCTVQVDNRAAGFDLVGLRIENGFSVVNIGVPTADEAALPRDIRLIRCAVLGNENGRSRRGVTASAKGVFMEGCFVGRDIMGPDAESQAFASFSGIGDYHLYHCYLEAAGENIIIGGSPSKLPNWTETNISFNHCMMVKKVEAWRRRNWNFDFHVKNLAELKRGKNVSFVGCFFQNSWGSQEGSAIVITSRCEHNRNPWHLIDGVRIENCYVTGTERCIGFLGRDNESRFAGACRNIEIINCLFDPCGNANTPKGSTQRGPLFLNGPENILWQNNTSLVRPNYLGVVFDSAPTDEKPTDPDFVATYPTKNLTIRNSIISGVCSGRGTANGKLSMDRFAQGYTVEGNALIGGGWNGFLGENGNRQVTREEALDDKLNSRLPGIGCDTSKFPVW